MSWFLSIEGPDGSGKSSLINKLKEYLNNQWVFTKEPGSPNDDVCLKIRELLLNPKNNISNSTELLLYLADRSQHVNNFILPRLSEGLNVISDRYCDSTFAYQCFGLKEGNKFSIDLINYLNNFATGGLFPDYSIILMIDPEQGLDRISKKEFGELDRIEVRNLDYHKRVISGYKYLIKNSEKYNRNFIIINADQDKEKIFEEVVSILTKKGVFK